MVAGTSYEHALGTLDLQAALAAALDLATAVDRTLDHMLSRQLPMPSLYLARGDRLRCLAQRGYLHVQDGLPITAGVAGYTYRTGRSIRVLAADAPDFIAAVPGIAEEVCVPIRVGEEVVGILNVESMDLLPAGALSIVEECSRLFGNRLTELGGPPTESTSDQLVRHAARLAALTQTKELRDYAVTAACALARMSSGAMIDLCQPSGATVVADVGPIGRRLHHVSQLDWATIAGQVGRGTSCHTSGTDEGATFVGYQALRDAGAHGMIIVPVFADGDCRALLVCAQNEPAAPGTELVERLELLAFQLGSCLQTVGALEELHGRTMQDPLTGLGNRTWFVEQVEERLQAWSLTGSGHFAVMFCDLDGFKDVNDSLGHDAGDRLLVIVSHRMRERLSSHDLLARLGGDEFGFCSDRFPTVGDAIRRADEVSEVLAPPFELDGVEVAITASVGITIVREDDPAPPDALTLLREADAAMYEAKRRGRSGVALFTDQLRRAATERLAIATGLRKAVADDQLELFYQPVVALTTGETVGVEALLRWNHPVRGLLAPDDFISIAEDTGAILELGTWALRQACKQLAVWDDTLDRTFPLSLGVNLSGRQLTDPALPAMVAAAMSDSGIGAERVILEITESTLMQDLTATRSVLDSLKALGVGIAIDDFGTGFSSLAYLRRFPVDILKIDRSFIEGLPDDAELSAIVAAIIAMAKALALDLVAEGVETAVQRDGLTALGCPNGQGHLFAAAQPVYETTRMLLHAQLEPAAESDS